LLTVIMMPLPKWEEQSGEPNLVSRICQNQRERIRGNWDWRKPYKAVPRNRKGCGNAMMTLPSEPLTVWASREGGRGVANRTKNAGRW